MTAATVVRQSAARSSPAGGRRRPGRPRTVPESERDYLSVRIARQTRETLRAVAAASNIPLSQLYRDVLTQFIALAPYDSQPDFQFVASRSSRKESGYIQTLFRVGALKPRLTALAQQQGVTLSTFIGTALHWAAQVAQAGPETVAETTA